ncbi:MAG: hypothetical protein ACRDL5_05325 [Solirubrobacteraceae bacterium]
MSQAPDRKRALRGAAAGAAAAGVWAIQQPLDKALFTSSYDDLEVLGRAVTRGEGWLRAGLALHLANGALFGAVYANVAPAVPLPPRLRGPVLAMLEHACLWPLTALCDRLHPAREQLPPLHGNRAAFWQATWRHLLFGSVLGELERLLNAEPEPAVPPAAPDYSSNGHGSLEHAVTVQDAP